jgi:hypothetical protein
MDATIPTKKARAPKRKPDEDIENETRALQTPAPATFLVKNPRRIRS